MNFPEPGSAPSLSVYYNKKNVSSETLVSSENWVQRLEITDLYADPSLTNKIGYKLQNTTDGKDVFQYQGTLYFDNGLGSITFLNGNEYPKTDPNVNQLYLDSIASGKGPFLLASGYIATVYTESDVVPVYVYLRK